MSISRRDLIKMVSGAVPVMVMPSALGRMPGSVRAKHPIPSYPVNPRFQPDFESLTQYRYPDWFRDAKLGFWSHWGPQAVPRYGTWYAKQMYMQGKAEYKYHVEHYGHPSKFGFKDIIPLWKAERWEPEKLMALYKKAGAKYFVSMGTHHDNFFLWNSKIHRWNAVNYGPKKDVVGLWQQAARKEGLRFGVSEHLAASFTWYQPSNGSDKTGPLKGVPYDGANPMVQDLYHAKAAAGDTEWLSINTEWQKEWLFSILELIDNYHPDLLYSDSVLPYDAYGRNMLAHFYNQNIQKNNGILDAVYTCKHPTNGAWVEDLERGVMDTFNAHPWQTDTSIGEWFYVTGQAYKSSTEVVQMLVDIVSKNGNLLLNIVQTPEGDVEADVLDIVDKIGLWTSVNGEGIYGTRPWKIYGENNVANAVNIKGGSFNEQKLKFEAGNIRFTTKDGALYAFCLGKPTSDIEIKSLGSRSPYLDKAIASVTLIGSNLKPHWKQRHDELLISAPPSLPVEQVPVVGYKITFKA